MEFNKQVTAGTVFGWELAIKGMRNPKKSWHLSDTVISINNISIGPNDMKLMQTLSRGGSEHRKYLRMLHVQLDVSFTRKIWSEFDTYKFVEKNSESTMHKLFAKDTPITRDMFAPTNFEETEIVINTAIGQLEKLRIKYLNAKGKEKNQILEAAKDALPESFYQSRVIDTNYEELRNIYCQRHNHRLSEWRDFCDWIKHNIPYFMEITALGDNID